MPAGFHLGHALLVVGTVLWSLALWDCYITQLDNTWLWVLLIGNVPAAFLYWGVYKNPYVHWKFSPAVNRWIYRDEMAQATYEVHQIGNAVQYAKLGDLLLEIGDLEAASKAYRDALAKEPENADALWGIVNIATKNGTPLAAKRELEELLKSEPDWQSGEARLLYVRLLFNTGDPGQGERELLEYLKKWDEPEARFYKARLTSERGNREEGRVQLQDLIEEIKDSAPIQFRRNRPWQSAAEQLLKGIK